ncbi:MAG: gluconeogenesis factor YvcK family protein [Acidimicrobiales bacterium]
MKVVAIGGGHGLAATLQAVRTFASSITAVVSVADDGGSSGLLREQLGIVPPGDLRKCLVALADPDSALAQAFERRYGDGEGHPLGNLVIAGLVEATGELQRALDEAARLVGACGRVVPASAIPVVLMAHSDSGDTVGQSAVRRTTGIRRVSLIPADAPASPAALDALGDADLVVLGPGSLFTSVIAAISVPDVAQAVRDSPGVRVYVANLQSEPAETEGLDVTDHVEALMAHGVTPDAVLADPEGLELGYPPVKVQLHALRSGLGPGGHDPQRLAKALAGLVG